MSSVVSLSSASTVSTAVWFSAGLNVSDEVNEGAAFASPGLDPSRSRSVTFGVDDQSRPASTQL